jgi:hypothetical protein
MESNLVETYEAGLSGFQRHVRIHCVDSGHGMQVVALPSLRLINSMLVLAHIVLVCKW